MSIVNVLVILALIATLVVLGLGLRSMARGGTYDAEHAEKFMWERVVLQTLVVVLLLAAAVLMNT
ncbi:MAG: twin transmembrane helix small protein [Gammaproteobacteria bacterium]|nr:twin transmembrane helix small protein [Gammaproteobacteria bacterium]NNF50118.1 twin transmembrane helix small protein [Woeseiaceae bacterium]MBT8095282.1 twin transmembrane helix small protein [Gammaproteobacteria bacterium]MBT8106265.1 twin transmembrane helix small protein [Gammaproteobacteria bacterium]NNK26279.1 twin transmembrane helix small protein [Woeseiaceae bacterium]